MNVKEIGEVVLALEKCIDTSSFETHCEACPYFIEGFKCDTMAIQDAIYYLKEYKDEKTYEKNN